MRPVWLATTLLVGLAIGWFSRDVTSDRELRSLLVSRDLVQVNFAVITLHLQDQRPHNVEKLQLFIIRSAVESLDDLTQKPVPLGRSGPALRQMLDRADAYSRTKGYTDLTGKISTIRQRLFGKS